VSISMHTERGPLVRGQSITSRGGCLDAEGRPGSKRSGDRGTGPGSTVVDRRRWTRGSRHRFYSQMVARDCPFASLPGGTAPGDTKALRDALLELDHLEVCEPPFRIALAFVSFTAP